VLTRSFQGASLPCAPTPEALATALAALSPAEPEPFTAGMLASPWGWFGAGEPGFRAFVVGARAVRAPTWPLSLRSRRWLQARWEGAPWEVSQALFWLHEGGAQSLGHPIGFAPTLTTFFRAEGQIGPLELWLPLA
jgi:hypothetical protein